MTNADEIADLLVETLNGDFYSIPFVAENPEIPHVARENAPPSVQIYGYEETETPSDRGDMLTAVRAVNLIVSAPLGDQYNKKDCLAWLNEIKDVFIELELTADNATRWRWLGNETITLYDFDAMLEKRQFYSLLRATFGSYI